MIHELHHRSSYLHGEKSSRTEELHKKLLREYEEEAIRNGLLRKSSSPRVVESKSLLSNELEKEAHNLAFFASLDKLNRERKMLSEERLMDFENRQQPKMDTKIQSKKRCFSKVEEIDKENYTDVLSKKILNKYISKNQSQLNDSKNRDFLHETLTEERQKENSSKISAGTLVSPIKFTPEYENNENLAQQIRNRWLGSGKHSISRSISNFNESGNFLSKTMEINNHITSNSFIRASPLKTVTFDLDEEKEKNLRRSSERNMIDSRRLYLSNYEQLTQSNGFESLNEFNESKEIGEKWENNGSANRESYNHSRLKSILKRRQEGSGSSLKRSVNQAVIGDPEFEEEQKDKGEENENIFTNTIINKINLNNSLNEISPNRLSRRYESGKKELKKCHKKVDKKSKEEKMHPHQSILNKISKRIQLSKMVFIDSTHSNISHEKQHLANTYANEIAMRSGLLNLIIKAVESKGRNRSRSRSQRA